MKTKAIFLITLSSLVVSAWAEESVQFRTVLHPRYYITGDDGGQGWFLTAWSITNSMSKTADNTNLFFGAGYSSRKWWLENMAQKQWNRAGASWWLDWRFAATPHSRISVYLEGAPRLGRKMFYEFMTLDFRVLGPVNIGAETENVHKPGKDVLGLGPRIAVPLPWKIAKAKPAIALSRQFRSGGPNATRLYAIFHWTF